MAKNWGIIGGFAASNSSTGQIEDCYCVTKFNGRKMTAGGFIGENAGRIFASFCQSIAHGLSGGFCGKNSKLDDKCYYVYNGKNKNSYWDKDHGRSSEDLEDRLKAREMGFDMDSVWEYNGRNPAIMFNTNTWFYDNAINSDKKIYMNIDSADKLVEFAGKVNSGDAKAICANVRLTADIDLSGVKWIPIGEKRENAFTGVFDGNGYSISNLIVKGEDCSKKGFFGYLRGAVYNLEIDCLIIGEGVIGGIAAVNEGTIGYCGVTIQCKGKGDELAVGGLVGNNSGKIYKSFAAGTFKFVLLPLLPFLIILCTACIAGAAVFTVSDYSKGRKLYNEFPSDPDQKRYEDDNIVENTEEIQGEYTKISFTFYENINVDRKSGECVLDFINPSDANSRIVVCLFMDKDTSVDAFDGDAWNNSYYDSNMNRVELARSGAIDPGYILNALYLNDVVRSGLKAGEYPAKVVLLAYDSVTNELKSVETEIPVTLTVN